eukprot:CAMPEP_0197929312 /NCGR_PEP_ID=MMETSP1439-20131203/103628_1 /TAXON_ID=66791 /ORGANISM="Gonyaulax spinifera, Strain CCMP409" /LENGTH=123 /DNA_ID=CAMNT_0043551947 /DNA_START=865 /DNA_END=1233 /DNA_ORIENTATION=+
MKDPVAVAVQPYLEGLVSVHAQRDGVREGSAPRGRHLLRLPAVEGADDEIALRGPRLSLEHATAGRPEGYGAVLLLQLVQADDAGVAPGPLDDVCVDASPAARRNPVEGVLVPEGQGLGVKLD